MENSKKDRDRRLVQNHYETLLDGQAWATYRCAAIYLGVVRLRKAVMLLSQLVSASAVEHSKMLLSSAVLEVQPLEITKATHQAALASDDEVAIARAMLVDQVEQLHRLSNVIKASDESSWQRMLLWLARGMPSGAQWSTVLGYWRRVDAKAAELAGTVLAENDSVVLTYDDEAGKWLRS